MSNSTLEDRRLNFFRHEDELSPTTDLGVSGCVLVRLSTWG